MNFRSPGAGLVFLTSVAMLFPSAAQAVPPMLTVQGQLSTSSGSPADGSYAITFGVYDDEVAGSLLWTETQVGLPVVGGLFDTVLGADTGGNPLGLPIFRDHAQAWLGIKIEAGPGVPVGGDPELPRSRLSTVSYAYVAEHAVSAADVSCTACVSEAELDFNVVTEAELAAALSALVIPTSIDGMSGGTITGDVIVQGNLDATTLSQGGNVVCDAANGGSCGSPSSRRWKQEIQPIEKALDKVRQLEGVRFVWKKDGRRDIGLIAEEVGKVVPEVVNYEGNGQDARTVNYGHLTALLVEAVKTQQAQIDTLQKKVEDLESAR